MNGAAHRDAALELEHSIADLGDLSALASRPYNGRALIELYWGAAFEWIAYGCQRLHSKHKEKHEGLARFLRDMAETNVADWWTTLESLRQGGFYGHHTDASYVQKAYDLWQEIRTWAQS